MSTDDVLARRARSFGDVAEQYDRYRPSYPPQLVADVVTLAGQGARTLDVGAGTGKGTTLLVAAGLDVVALEPDPAMAAVLRTRLPGLPVHVETFEQCTATGPFDLLTSAQAWHWTDQDTHWDRAASLLRPGGLVALWWNHSRLTGCDDAAIDAVYARHCPHIPSDTGEGGDETASLTTSWPGPQMASAPVLRDHEARHYAWRRSQTRDEYLASLDTQSPYRVLPDEVRAAFFDDLAGALPGTITSEMATGLHLARVR